MSDRWLGTREGLKLKKASVLLWSGGLDSTAALLLENPNLVVHIIAGDRAQYKIEQERVRVLKTLIDHKLGTRAPDLIFYEHKVQDWEYGSSAYVPFRNLTYIIDAYNEALRYWRPNWPKTIRVWVVGVLGGYQSDKSPEAFKSMTKFLNDMLAASVFHNDAVKFPKLEVYSPFWGVTKAMLIRRIEKRYDSVFAEQVERAIVSCYNVDEMGTPCGECSACWRFFVAMTLGAKRDIRSWFKSDITRSKAGRDYYVRAKARRYPVQKNKEHIKVWEACERGNLEDLLK